MTGLTGWFERGRELAGANVEGAFDRLSRTGDGSAERAALLQKVHELSWVTASAVRPRHGVRGPRSRNRDPERSAFDALIPAWKAGLTKRRPDSMPGLVHPPSSAHTLCSSLPRPEWMPNDTDKAWECFDKDAGIAQGGFNRPRVRGSGWVRLILPRVGGRRAGPSRGRR